MRLLVVGGSEPPRSRPHPARVQCMAEVIGLRDADAATQQARP
jgi:hypothetical protein